MKQIFILIFLSIISNQMFSQQNKDFCCLSKADIIGIWQEDSPIVGSGFNQNFEFFDNGTFVLHLGHSGDDVRDIIELKGKYRLDKDKLYFTIISKTIIEGKIGIADAGINHCIFEIENGKEKEIQESNPKELADPCYITIIKKSHIKIGNEIYYKIN